MMDSATLALDPGYLNDLNDPKVETTTTTTTHTTVDGDHGRIETRTALVSTDISWHYQWPGLAAIAKVERVRELPTETETAYCLLSALLSAERFGRSFRQTGSIGASTAS